MANRLYQKRACRNLQFRDQVQRYLFHCIRKEPAAIYNVLLMSVLFLPIVSEKSLPQSTIAFDCLRRANTLYQKRACRNLQYVVYAPNIPHDCIRKEPAAIYNHRTLSPFLPMIVSEKSLPQSTMVAYTQGFPQQLYQKRACRNLQCLPADGLYRPYCIRKEPAAIYNAYCRAPTMRLIVSEKSLPQSTMHRALGIGAGQLYQKRACRNLQSCVCLAMRGLNCIRKEPAAIYNANIPACITKLIVSEKSLPQSTI